MGRAVGVRGFLSVGSNEKEGMQEASPVRQGAVKEAAGSLSHPSHRNDRQGPTPGWLQGLSGRCPCPPMVQLGIQGHLLRSSGLFTRDGDTYSVGTRPPGCQGAP